MGDSRKGIDLLADAENDSQLTVRQMTYTTTGRAALTSLATSVRKVFAPVVELAWKMAPMTPQPPYLLTNSPTSQAEDIAACIIAQAEAAEAMHNLSKATGVADRLILLSNSTCSTAAN